MDLKTYIKENKLNIKGFADQFNVPYATVWRIVHGATPSVRTAKEIEAVTGGDVPASVSLGL